MKEAWIQYSAGWWGLWAYAVSGGMDGDGCGSVGRRSEEWESMRCDADSNFLPNDTSTVGYWISWRGPTVNWRRPIKYAGGARKASSCRRYDQMWSSKLRFWSFNVVALRCRSLFLSHMATSSIARPVHGLLTEPNWTRIEVYSFKKFWYIKMEL